MKLLFVADGRSPIATNWIRYWTERGHHVHLASTFACEPQLHLDGLDITPVAFSEVKYAPARTAAPRGILWGAATLGLRTVMRQWLGPATLPRAAKNLRAVIARVQPDLVHALRIPYEGMLAAEAMQGLAVPLLTSVWGNDFTLHAPASPLMGHFTRRALQRADALHADCERDIRIARRWGFDANRPTLVTPGNGGIRTDIFFPPAQPVAEPVILNPRGFRAYVRSDTFFKAIPLVLKHQPQARFLCTSMAHEPHARAWIQSLGIADSVELLPPMPHHDMANVFRRAQILVSPATHDGTPNTLLEGLACGCFPIAGDLESIREWITPNMNGLLVDPANPQALAEAILAALNDPVLRARALEHNQTLIAERAEYTRNMARVKSFYHQIMS